MITKKNRNRFLKDEKTKKTIVCFLLVGQMKSLAKYCLESALKQVSCEVAIGYINEADIHWIPKLENIRFIKIESKLILENNEYKDFTKPDFYRIVTNKWDLLIEASNLGFDYVIYSDLDVIWFRNPTPVVEKSFIEFPSIDFLIQSFTRESNLTCLCMGFLAMRVSARTQKLLQECKKHHMDSLREGDMLGDDEVITSYFRRMNYPSWIRELPQSTFPTGNLYPLFMKHNKFPYMEMIQPYVFHLNFVIGIRNKEIFLWYLRVLSRLRIEGPSTRRAITIISELLLEKFVKYSKKGVKEIRFKNSSKD
jgi:hypothetical protein